LGDPARLPAPPLRGTESGAPAHEYSDFA